jgi:hypothetical protein
MSSRKLTEQQMIFLEALFNEAAGDFVFAKKLAGYHDTYPTSSIVKTLEEEILAETKRFISRSGPKAVLQLVSALDNPTQLGIKFKLDAARDILDRAGISKTEKIDITSNGIFVLPAKDFANG